ncbi:hypothetical protein BUALT_Bualt02G0188800 [Buddleja alternifolia]|uniref:Uncharacterized protein n=1 Tax=Buddleja alternifolia TaxID=168488 RepID=A0AAV6YC39_9LAMI|nr:hypothetical protein BUALT_Bualt02G0188800 [Buddleja alternifolia]
MDSSACAKVDQGHGTSLCAKVDQGNGEKPLCVISDLFFGWAADVAHELGIFHAIFSSDGGFGMACYYSMWLNLPHKHTENVEFLLPDFPEAGKLHVSQVSPAMHQAGEHDSMTKFFWEYFPTLANSDMLLINTVEKIDKIGLMYLRRKLGIPVLAIVARGTNFDVRQENIMEKMELVMGESEKGKELRRKACEIKEIIRDATRDEETYKGSSVKAMEEFFNAARDMMRSALCVKTGESDL